MMTIRSACILGLGGLLLCVSPAVRADGLAAQRLAKGQSAILATDYLVGDVAITDQSVCDYLVKDSRREVYLNARKPGSAVLTIWDTQGVKRDAVPVTVTAADQQELDAAATALFGAQPKVRFVQRGEETILEGELGSEEELAKASALARTRPGVRADVHLSGKALQGLAAQVTRAINRPGVVVRLVKQRLVLEGIVYSTEAYAHAEKIARLYDPDVLNLLEVRDTKRTPGARPLIQLDVYFMEMKKSALKRLGILWAPGAGTRGGGGDAAPGGFFGGIGNVVQTAVGTIFNLLPKLLFAREKGLARILEHPHFLVKSGETVDFFSGTEVPYFSQQNVLFKEVGLKLQAEPIAYGDDVDLKIQARISSLSSGVRQGIDTRTISTSIAARNGQAVVLGGLFTNGDAKGMHRMPEGMETNSALFTLVASRDFQSHQSDFLVFLIPRILDRPPPAEERLEEWMRLNEAVTAAQPARLRRQPSFHRDQSDLRIRAPFDSAQGSSSGARAADVAAARPSAAANIISLPDSLARPQ
ncbi:MAG: pilus assembly protein N-terminal domain-containing protein [Deltaproteobacteria bacterium]|nr:pilus assembly protein N-terminal domain-containing protein [Deltaproteobacteria bacterium]